MGREAESEQSRVPTTYSLMLKALTLVHSYRKGFELLTASGKEFLFCPFTSSREQSGVYSTSDSALGWDHGFWKPSPLQPQSWPLYSDFLLQRCLHPHWRPFQQQEHRLWSKDDLFEWFPFLFRSKVSKGSILSSIPHLLLYFHEITRVTKPPFSTIAFWSWRWWLSTGCWIDLDV